MHNNLKPLIELLEFLTKKQPNLNSEFRTGTEINDADEEITWCEYIFTTLDETSVFTFTAFDGAPEYCDTPMPYGAVCCHIETNDPNGSGSFDNVPVDAFFKSLEAARYE